MNPIPEIQKIKSRRIELGIGQRKLHELSGVSLPYLNRLEVGIYRNPTLDLLNRLCAALDSAEKARSVKSRRVQKANVPAKKRGRA